MCQYHRKNEIMASGYSTPQPFDVAFHIARGYFHFVPCRDKGLEQEHIRNYARNFRRMALNKATTSLLGVGNVELCIWTRAAEEKTGKSIWRSLSISPRIQYSFVSAPLCSVLETKGFIMRGDRCIQGEIPLCLIPKALKLPELWVTWGLISCLLIDETAFICEEALRKFGTGSLVRAPLASSLIYLQRSKTSTNELTTPLLRSECNSGLQFLRSVLGTSNLWVRILYMAFVMHIVMSREHCKSDLLKARILLKLHLKLAARITTVHQSGQPNGIEKLDCAHRACAFICGDLDYYEFYSDLAIVNLELSHGTPTRNWRVTAPVAPGVQCWSWRKCRDLVGDVGSYSKAMNVLVSGHLHFSTADKICSTKYSSQKFRELQKGTYLEMLGREKEVFVTDLQCVCREASFKTANFYPFFRRSAILLDVNVAVLMHNSSRLVFLSQFNTELVKSRFATLQSIQQKCEYKQQHLTKVKECKHGIIDRDEACEERIIFEHISTVLYVEASVFTVEEMFAYLPSLMSNITIMVSSFLMLNCFWPIGMPLQTGASQKKSILVARQQAEFPKLPELQRIRKHFELQSIRYKLAASVMVYISIVEICVAYRKLAKIKFRGVDCYRPDGYNLFSLKCSELFVSCKLTECSGPTNVTIRFSTNLIAQEVFMMTLVQAGHLPEDTVQRIKEAIERSPRLNGPITEGSGVLPKAMAYVPENNGHAMFIHMTRPFCRFLFRRRWVGEPAKLSQEAKCCRPIHHVGHRVQDLMRIKRSLPQWAH
ncbi:hypothetical protein C0J52_25231 [Blattella germanica]|nr:hypothetical protein C0J52_25231 [Blattella germanica]